MNHKMMSAAGCLFLLAAAMVPTVLGHDDNLSRAGDKNDGVAGTFFGPAGVYVAFNGNDIPTDPPTDPDFSVSGGSMFCDVEVLGDGTSEQEPDETVVDGEPVAVGTVPDGTFDDGGDGGACHTNHYDYDNNGVDGPGSGYNTPGCDATEAFANNLGGTGGIAAPWVVASCDWKTSTGGTPDSAILETCLINGILDGIDDQPAEAIACVLTFITCSTAPVSCTDDATESCGSDAVADGANFGNGNAGVPYPRGVDDTAPFETDDDDTFLGDELDCPESDATMAAFMFNGVTVSQTGTPVTVNPAIQGDIWEF
jgi:hypothetical protein